MERTDEDSYEDRTDKDSEEDETEVEDDERIKRFAKTNFSGLSFKDYVGEV